VTLRFGSAKEPPAATPRDLLAHTIVSIKQNSLLEEMYVPSSREEKNGRTKKKINLK